MCSPLLLWGTARYSPVNTLPLMAAIFPAPVEEFIAPKLSDDPVVEEFIAVPASHRPRIAPIAAAPAVSKPASHNSPTRAPHNPRPAAQGIVCCCQAAPCCFPDGCCPDGCCPDSMCPNGCLGEQFEGCCMIFGAAGGSGGCCSFGGCFATGEAAPKTDDLSKILSKLVVTQGLSPDAVRAAASGAAKHAAHAAKQQQQDEKKRRENNNTQNKTQSERETKQSKANRKQITTLHKLFADGMLTKPQYDAAVNKILGLQSDLTDSTVYCERRAGLNAAAGAARLPACNISHTTDHESDYRGPHSQIL